MNRDLSKGSVVKSMLLFAIPMILGDLLQQCYNIADTLIVGQFLGEKALAAVGSSFTLMTFITSIILGLCIGSGVLFSIRFGQRDENGLKEDICASFFFITAVTILLNIIAYISLSGLRTFLRQQVEALKDKANAQSANFGELVIVKLGHVEPLQVVVACRWLIQAA